MGPSFYTSYASSAGDRGAIQRFHFDVQHELTRRGGSYANVRGSLRRAEPASGPPPDLLDCAALLALYSPEYLEEEACALEWSVFAERMDRLERLTGRRPASLVGVLWQPEGLVLPQVVTSSGRILADVSGQGYRGRGVRELQSDPHARMLYRRTVSAVADELLRAVASPLPAMSEAAARDVQPRFGPSRGGRRPEPPPAAPTTPEEREGPVRRLVVALVAGTSAKMEQLRTSVAAYGSTPEEWSPFAPQSLESAVSVVSRTLRACGLDGVRFVALDADHALPRLRTDDDSAVVLVVDPWLTEDAAFPVLWERLARCEAGVSAVIVVLPRQDDESRLHTSRLRDSFARTPARLLGAAHHEVGTPQALAYTVAGVLADVASEGGGQGIPLGPPVESAAERRSRRRRERAEWLTPATGQQASLVGRASGELWGDG